MDKALYKKGVFAICVGTTYILFGILQSLNLIGLANGIWVPLHLDESAIGSLILFVIGIIFVYGHHKLKKNAYEGIAFLFTGILISLMYSALYLLVFGAEVAMVLMGGGTELPNVMPTVYLGMLPLAGFLIWRRSFSFIRLSDAGA